jgi:hypothetical protein
MMFTELARLLDELAGQEVTHALRMRRNAQLLELCNSTNLPYAKRLGELAHEALQRAGVLMRCVRHLGGDPRGRARLPTPTLEHLDVDTILSNELVEALDAANAFAEVERYTGELDLRTLHTLSTLRAARERELGDVARMLDEHRSRHDQIAA